VSNFAAKNFTNANIYVLETQSNLKTYFPIDLKVLPVDVEDIDLPNMAPLFIGQTTNITVDQSDNDLVEVPLPEYYDFNNDTVQVQVIEDPMNVVEYDHQTSMIKI